MVLLLGISCKKKIISDKPSSNDWWANAPRTSSFKRDKRPSWYSTRVCKAAGGRNVPNPSVIEYGRGIRLWIFLVPKRDLRTDEVHEFVESRRRHEAILYSWGYNRKGTPLFLVFDLQVFFPKAFSSLSHVAFPKLPQLCLPKQHPQRLQMILTPSGKPTTITRQTVSNSSTLSYSSWCFLALYNSHIVSWFPTSLIMHFWLGKHSSFFLAECVGYIDLYRFASTVGQFVLAASFRSQVNPGNKDEFKDISPEQYVYFSLQKKKK